MLKESLYYGKILLFGEYGIIKDSMGLSIPYSDYNGKFLLSTDRSVIDLSDYPCGIYLLKVFYGNKTKELRIIKE